jgi:hypothetical protein
MCAAITGRGFTVDSFGAASERIVEVTRSAAERFERSGQVEAESSLRFLVANVLIVPVVAGKAGLKMMADGLGVTA